MAKITCEFDTVEKTLAVSVDGKSVTNINEVYFIKSYSDEDDYSASLCTLTKNDDDGTMQMTRLVASESTEGKTLRGNDEHKDYPGFLVVASEPKAIQDIQNFFSKE